MTAFWFSVTDRYPPFTLERSAEYPVDVSAERPSSSSRVYAAFTVVVEILAVAGGIALFVWAVNNVDWTSSTSNTSRLNFNWQGYSGLLLRQLAAVPHLIVLVFLGIAAFVLWFIGQWVILFTASLPRGMWDLIAGYVRWSTRVSAYTLGLIDRYPPFSMQPSTASPAAPIGFAAPPPGGPVPPPPAAPQAPPSTPGPLSPIPGTQPPAAAPAPPAPPAPEPPPAPSRRSGRSGMACSERRECRITVVPAAAAWGISSVGRAPGSHPGGQRFESAMLHHHFSSSHDADRTGRDCDRAATVDQAGQIVERRDHRYGRRYRRRPGQGRDRLREVTVDVRGRSLTVESGACVLCGDVRADAVLTVSDRLHDVDGGPDTRFTLVRCRTCRLVYLDPRPAADEIGDYYSDDYNVPHAGGRLARLEESYRLRQQREVVRWLAELRPGRGRLLDVGCGAGELLAALRDDGWEACGVEPSPRSAALAARARGLDVRTAPFEHADLGPPGFDAVVFAGVLEHLPDPVAALRRAASCSLRPAAFWRCCSCRCWTRRRPGCSARAGWLSTCRATSTTSSRDDLPALARRAGLRIVATR